MILKNETLKVTFSDPKEYSGTRFDHTLTVKQVELDGTHTFLGHEETPAGIGTGGFGLHCGWLWKKIPSHQSGYPVPGIGILAIPEHQQYSVRENYPFIPARQKELLRTEAHCIVESVIPDFCKVVREVELSGRKITLSSKISNLSSEIFDIEEYCHNFIQFDGYPIDQNVRVTFCSPLFHSVVRGELAVGTNCYEPIAFDETLGTIALACEPYGQNGYPDTVTLSDRRTGTYVTIRDGFIASRGYQWMSEYCICPESFHQMNIHPQKEVQFFKEYTFGMR